ncbi:bifunctional 4-hydroxy-2-oxoglutarate aldolase/2-dehydro-3-deoxy-phosphogluconate aldolase [Anaerococcus lactolyticus]|uniref:2-dehydro-3-deoxyphosphogluconate aldolase n=1 Tax=Anaerococcus lactolyticus S7-1-13 TaxID=1284686 RepID=A0A095X7U8_9FIRM|nr:bifunctional 4-hydroxy-2-oxoglutarate aldolase/2-dehydro-3-deoxy-phosphogluconate aldolase [Anaerococcus lactolyticus]KGF06185.1 2-dehydro-3-deoxyphosphogluconate aldolase [Anaerococcus lactolyticus S7-1-13]
MSKKKLSKVTVILRGYSYEQIKCVAQTLISSSINSIEVTLNSPDVYESIKKIKQDFPELNVGAGTVCTIEEVMSSIESGVDFILSPINLSKEAIELCNKNDVVCVPAAMTPSEIYKMFQYGADIVKIFPATAVGAKFFKDIQAPLGNLELMAVGGVNGDNAKEFLANKCNYLGIGSGIFEKQDIKDMNMERLKLSLNKFIENVEV